MTPTPCWSRIRPTRKGARSAGAAGDVNGDGYSDVIVGAPDFDNGEDNKRGRALVFLGSAGGIVGSNPGSAHALLESDQIYAEMGRSVGTAGDVNGNGYPDVIIGVHDYDNGEVYEGAALVFLGSAGGIVGSKPGNADALLESDRIGASMGRSVGTAGDVNGDGYSDVIVGASQYDDWDGVALAFLGSAGGIVA